MGGLHEALAERYLSLSIPFILPFMTVYSTNDRSDTPVTQAQVPEEDWGYSNCRNNSSNNNDNINDSNNAK